MHMSTSRIAGYTPYNIKLKVVTVLSKVRITLQNEIDHNIFAVCINGHMYLRRNQDLTRCAVYLPSVCFNDTSVRQQVIIFIYAISLNEFMFHLRYCIKMDTCYPLSCYILATIGMFSNYLDPSNAASDPGQSCFATQRKVNPLLHEYLCQAPPSWNINQLCFDHITYVDKETIFHGRQGKLSPTDLTSKLCITWSNSYHRDCLIWVYTVCKMRNMLIYELKG